MASAAFAKLRTQLTRLAKFHPGRGGRARLAIAAGFAAKAWLVFVALASVPLTIAYLGNEGYGLLLAVTSVVTWLQFTSLGIGSGLQNAFAEAVGKEDRESQQALLSTAVVGLLVLGVVIFIAAGALAYAVDWNRLFPTASGRFDSETRRAALLAVLAFCCSMAFSFVPAVLNARQETHIAYLIQVIAGTTSLGGIVLATRLDLGLAGMVAATAVAPALVIGAAGAWLLYLRGLAHLRPRIARFSASCLRGLANRSLWFFVLTFSNIALFQSDIFILARVQGAEAAAPFGVAQRAFAQIAGLFTIVSGTLWVAYGNAKAQGDVAWIERTYLRFRRLQVMTFAAALALMLTLGEPLLRLWVGAEAAPGWPLLAACAALFVVQQWTSTHALMLNGLDILQPQAACLLLNGILLIALAVAGASAFGATGLALGCALAYGLTSAWYLPLLVRRAIAAMKHSREGDRKA